MTLYRTEQVGWLGDFSWHLRRALWPFPSVGLEIEGSRLVYGAAVHLRVNFQCAKTQNFLCRVLRNASGVMDSAYLDLDLKVLSREAYGPSSVDIQSAFAARCRSCLLLRQSSNR